MVWLDECKVVFEGYRRGRKVRIKPGAELLDQNLTPSFRSGRFGVGCWGAFAYGSRSPLIRLRQHQPTERTSVRDHLGVNGEQYATEVNEPYLIPYLLSLPGNIEDYLILQDNVGYHISGKNRRIYPAYGVQILGLPASSPDLNPIENIWEVLKARLRHRFTIPENRPNNEDELWTAMAIEWENIDQHTFNSLANSMPNRVQSVISNNGGHIKW